MNDLVKFAVDAGIELLRGDQLVRSGNFREDYSIDFGRVVQRTPAAVLRPRDRAALQACMRHLYAAGTRYTTRGGAHSSGGQALIDGGVVIDTRYLDRICSDDPDAETITVEGGAPWRAVVDHLRPQGRRPTSITANLRSSVAGTLAVGGFGDSAHTVGLQISHVERLTLITPDGACHHLGPEDELFRWSLAGRGQLGVIAEVTLQTVRRPWTMVSRALQWESLADFVRDNSRIVEHGLYDFMRARIRVNPEGSSRVYAHVGRSTSTRSLDDDSLARLHPAKATDPALLDLYALLASGKEDSADACPALEVVLPLPAGLAIWDELAKQIAAAGIPALQPHGHSVMVVARDPRFPLAPLPPTANTAMMIALRPSLPVDALPALLPALHAIARTALDAGARIYLMSIDIPTPDFLAKQFGADLATLLALKARVDPKALLNPGLL